MAKPKFWKPLIHQKVKQKNVVNKRKIVALQNDAWYQIADMIKYKLSITVFLFSTSVGAMKKLSTCEKLAGLAGNPFYSNYSSGFSVVRLNGLMEKDDELRIQARVFDTETLAKSAEIQLKGFSVTVDVTYISPGGPPGGPRGGRNGAMKFRIKLYNKDRFSIDFQNLALDGLGLSQDFLLGDKKVTLFKFIMTNAVSGILAKVSATPRKLDAVIFSHVTNLETLLLLEAARLNLSSQHKELCQSDLLCMARPYFMQTKLGRVAKFLFETLGETSEHSEKQYITILQGGSTGNISGYYNPERFQFILQSFLDRGFLAGEFHRSLEVVLTPEFLHSHSKFLFGFDAEITQLN